MSYADDTRWEIPRKFRVSMKMDDTEAYNLLLECDAQQRELGERMNSVVTTNTPQEIARSKAFITIEALLRAQRFTKLVPDQIEQLAESYAHVGRYDLAAVTTKNPDLKVLHRAYWEAIFKPDGSWCEHPVNHAYLKERIYSMKHAREKSLIECNVCHFINVTNTPNEIKAQNAPIFGGGRSQR